MQKEPMARRTSLLANANNMPSIGVSAILPRRNEKARPDRTVEESRGTNPGGQIQGANPISLWLPMG
jgi:hypothetical protein